MGGEGWSAAATGDGSDTMAVAVTANTVEAKARRVFSVMSSLSLNVLGDPRYPVKVEHSAAETLRTRIYGILADYRLSLVC